MDLWKFIETMDVDLVTWSGTLVAASFSGVTNVKISSSSCTSKKSNTSEIHKMTRRNDKKDRMPKTHLLLIGSDGEQATLAYNILFFVQ